MSSKLSNIALGLAVGLIAAPALAHSQLQQAVPAVGGTIKGSPPQLTLRFSEGIEPRFSSVTLAAQGGGAVPLGRISVGPPEATVVTIKVGKILKPGTYTVNWRATSTDSHKTQGSYTFTVAP